MTEFPYAAWAAALIFSTTVVPVSPASNVTEKSSPKSKDMTSVSPLTRESKLAAERPRTCAWKPQRAHHSPTSCPYGPSVSLGYPLEGVREVQLKFTFSIVMQF